MTILYTNLCYNEVCYKGTAINMYEHNILPLWYCILDNNGQRSWRQTWRRMDPHTR